MQIESDDINGDISANGTRTLPAVIEGGRGSGVARLVAETEHRRSVQLGNMLYVVGAA